MQTIVLSGPQEHAPQARAMLRSKGMDVEESLDNVRSNEGQVSKRDYNHGFERASGEAFITARGDLDDWQVVEALGFSLRLHWEQGTEGEWTNNKRQRDPFSEHDRLVSALRAQGITLPEGI